MGYRLPPAVRADDSFIFSLEEAVSAPVKRLYPGESPSPTGQSPRTRKEHRRNSEIGTRYAQGISVPALAREYGISKNRVYQILSGRRK